MKMTIKSISTVILTIAIFYSSALACGEQNNGSRCGGLVDNQPTVTDIKTEKDKDSPVDNFLHTIENFLVKFFV